MTPRFQSIDVKQMVASKNPKLAKWLPGFVFRFLKRIIHQEEVNEILRKYAHLEGLEFVAALLKHLNVTYTVHGAEHIAKGERVLFVSNHPLGGFDGIVLLDVLGAKRTAVKAVVNDLLMLLNPLKSLFVPVNKHGMQTQLYAKQLQAEYDSETPILYFPAGLCSRKKHGKITDLEWKKSTVKIARDYRRDVVPIYFEGHNSKFFYALANIRKLLGVKANLEMLFLPDEFFKQRNAHYHVFVGEPIAHEFLTQTKNLNEMITFVREKTYELPQKYNLEH